MQGGARRTGSKSDRGPCWTYHCAACSCFCYGLQACNRKCTSGDAPSAGPALWLRTGSTKLLSRRPSSRIAALHSDYLPADKPLASSFQLFLDSDRNHVVICSLTVSHQPGHPPLPSRFCVRPRSLSTFDCQLLTSSSSTFQCAGRLPRLPRLPRASRGPDRGVGACRACPDFVGELLGTLDFSSLGLILNLQLSTFNRVSFPSPSSPYLCALCALCGENSSSFRSCLMSRHSPLATNSFIIRTSETPLPQLLYNPHLQAPLGSAGNKGLITGIIYLTSPSISVILSFCSTPAQFRQDGA